MGYERGGVSGYKPPRLTPTRRQGNKVELACSVFVVVSDSGHKIKGNYLKCLYFGQMQRKIFMVLISLWMAHVWPHSTNMYISTAGMSFCHLTIHCFFPLKAGKNTRMEPQIRNDLLF